MHVKYEKRLLLLLSAFIFLQVKADSCCESHQFVPRSITTDLVYDDVFNYYERHYADRNKFIYSGTALYQKSKKSESLGSAFLLKNGCNCVDVTQNAPGDINSVWLGLQNNDPNNPFSSKFCIEPERREVGYHSYWYLNLEELICGLWIDVATAVINVAHDLNCCEQGNNAAACPGITTVGEALNNDLYNFGKFYCGPCNGKKRRTGLDDIQVRIGYEQNWCDDVLNVGLYLIGTIPTGRKPTAEYVFEPLIGSRHGSIGFGLNGDYQFWCDAGGDKSLTLMTDANYRYAFSSNTCRTFDLCSNNAFSRFLLLAEQDNPGVPLPGVNFLTQNVDIEPKGTIQWWLAMHYEHCDYDLEFGYNLFWRQKEDLKKCLGAPCKTVAVYDLNCAGSGCTSASTATIGTYATDLVEDAAFTPITAQDSNVRSALAGDVLSNKLYAAGSWQGSCSDCFDWLAGLGGSYEFVSDKYACNALPKWAVFGRFSLMF